MGLMESGCTIDILSSDCQIHVMPIRFSSESDARFTDELPKWTTVPPTVQGFTEA